MATPGTSWRQYRIDPCWYNYRDIDYRNEPFNDDASLRYWVQLGFSNIKFTGDMYDMRRTAPDWMPTVLEHFTHWEHASWSVYRMTPGACLPKHSDTYARFRELHGIRPSETVVRAIIFLEDWQSGHYFEIDNTPVVEWSAGTVVEWTEDTPHIAANFGFTDRYSLQITGKL